MCYFCVFGLIFSPYLLFVVNYSLVQKRLQTRSKRTRNGLATNGDERRIRKRQNNNAFDVFDAFDALDAPTTFDVQTARVTVQSRLTRASLEQLQSVYNRTNGNYTTNDKHDPKHDIRRKTHNNNTHNNNGNGNNTNEA